jgi:hypothetical protein
MNTIDSLILANLALISILLDKYSGQDNGNIIGAILYLFVGSFVATVPMVVMVVFVSYKFIKMFVPSAIKQKACCLKLKRKGDIEANHPEDSSESSDVFGLPDRILHPEEYEEETSMKPIGIMGSTKYSRNLSI